MTVKCCLLSSTAIVKRFQAENILESPVRISQSCVVLENLCGGFNTIPAVTDGHVAVPKAALAECRMGKSCTVCEL